MPAPILSEEIKKIFLTKYSQIGSDSFYQFLIEYGTNRLNKGEMQAPTPEIELLSYHDKFLSLYRKDNKEEYLELAKLCRRAAQKLYNIMLEVGLTEENNKFLNLVLVK